ncbi:phosphoribosyl-ATP diphosphatase [Pararhodospirillum oryzae]|uniref:Phosphoribosyl-ATP pyrophosphatase n=1 Tax=Pararhodospirillum oryzae TaxID=478448 RepID=A0A512H5U9_9PROT|nr:phosphoribosyl-ATP diphosphatase [Pararhodospirillum oryzae]GEO80808.1 phosphoribosyl-ATP pyrophosphatase [Pararhodospirillum oryzae]
MSQSAAVPGPEIIEALYAVIASRRGVDPDQSYTARLFAKGRVKICNKMGEEAFEVAAAALAEGPDHVVSESADLLYHLMVLWADTGVEPASVWAELARRFGTSGIDEKAARKG